MDEIERLIWELEDRINARQEQLRLADAAAKALDEKIIANMAERLIWETEMVLKEEANE
jgi:hypothetical protein